MTLVTRLSLLSHYQGLLKNVPLAFAMFPRSRNTRKRHLSIRLLIVEIHILFITQEDMYAPIVEKHLMKTIPTIKHTAALPMPL